MRYAAGGTAAAESLHVICKKASLSTSDTVDNWVGVALVAAKVHHI